MSCFGSVSIRASGGSAVEYRPGTGNVLISKLEVDVSLQGGISGRGKRIKEKKALTTLNILSIGELEKTLMRILEYANRDVNIP